VKDNGRGIPVDMHPKTGKSALETVMTILHAGGKFGGEGGYKVSGGLHGVGASVVNALSTKLVAEVHRGNKLYRQEYTKGGSQIGPLEVVGATDYSGTTVTFWPDNTIFHDFNEEGERVQIHFDWDKLNNRLRQMAFLNKGL